ncbi:MAG: nucleoside triphosphate pyrophosphohydrolase [Chitinophagaceae bacterium]|jgi:XTP/dITP diphosphohydrolase|nr:nucleoside triphosphate pyrophosphohydrolase [Chitinophagaceae bacterium]MBP6987745.1 nucleoside triphosphate pyrophosphohydrolase [Ferruginibacter sp.]NMD28751.1 nucleoside triphosphate pyrophosphohydrolase [Bacteroidota bacterium]MBK7346052.1 nucleoside triphosphate pyrophosphohydrolase [Chitinophagaceae bacterium]MBK8930429.1 nucleoside triphosphate pyrophosphohydrolase [Chitinophagaceae bacterium]
MESVADSFLKLIKIMNELREQCPWDKKQTIHTLRQMTIEETYELADAITDNNLKAIKEELGDLLLHIVFYSKIGQEQNAFTLQEVIDGICQKLIVRHPHIYADVKVKDADEVKQNWEKIKLREGRNSVLDGVPNALPAMIKALRLQEKSKQVGFEWSNKAQVWDKVKEEMEELKEAEKSGIQDKIEDEMGDLLFSLINFARFLQVDPENALERTNKKFIRRFTLMEQEAKKQSRMLHNMTLEEMDDLWNNIKNHE